MCTLLKTSFKAISSALVSANTSAPRTITSREQFSSFANVSYDPAASLEGMASFTLLPLQPVPRGLSQFGPITSSLTGQLLDIGFLSGPIERAFLSGPLERAFLYGPLERGCVSAPMEARDRSFVSAPLSISYYAAYFKTRRRSLAHVVKNLGYPVKKALSRSLSKTSLSLAKTHKSLTAPVRLLRGLSKDASRDEASQYDCPLDSGYTSSSSDSHDERHNLQWAQGKAGEDRMHVVLSEEHGWLYVGIYDGFSGPDAPDFLMSNLYKEVYKELRGLLWDAREMPTFNAGDASREDQHEEECVHNPSNTDKTDRFPNKNVQNNLDPRSASDSEFAELDHNLSLGECKRTECVGSGSKESLSEKTQTSNLRAQGDTCEPILSRRHPTVGSLSQMKAVDHVLENCEARMVKANEELGLHQLDSNALPEKKRRIWFQRSLSEHKPRKVSRDKKGQNNHCVTNLEARHEGRFKKPMEESCKLDKAKLQKNSIPDHSGVLKALASALESTERMFLQMADHSLKEMPELALMGSCVLVMLMKGEDVYVMNVGDSRAIVAQTKFDPKGPTQGPTYDLEKIGARDTQLRQELERIMEETPTELETFGSSHTCSGTGPPATSLLLTALQLTADHSTNVEEEVLRIQSEHSDDKKSIANDRVKGRLKVTRAFGAGFLKLPRWNHALLEMFRVDYVGTAPYVTCEPAVHHHALGPNDRFLVLSSDGLYQYFSNEEVVAQVEWFIENYPDGDPAQNLIEELLFRAAKKAGMDFHELLDIPQGDRRKYHDDVSIMVISLEGRIWRSFG